MVTFLPSLKRRFLIVKFLSAHVGQNKKIFPYILSLFQPPHTYKNEFTVGMKLEGIDPLHPSSYCVLTVAELKGLRLRLHFDGYSEVYDFWTYCYSDQIFPVGWCAENKKSLLPPKGEAVFYFMISYIYISVWMHNFQNSNLFKIWFL